MRHMEAGAGVSTKDASLSLASPQTSARYFLLPSLGAVLCLAFKLAKCFTMMPAPPLATLQAHGGGVRCTFEGCTKAARDGRSSLCARHGGGRRCSFVSDQGEGCVKFAEAPRGQPQFAAGEGFAAISAARPSSF